MLNSCISLKKLDLCCDRDGADFHFRDLLLSQKQFERLEARNFSDLDYVTEAVTEFGRGLAHLVIPLNVSHKTVITRMFQSAGATLTSLDATVYVGNADPIADMFDLKTIRDWCPLIPSLFVKLTNASSETVLQRSHLILSYRGQLKDFNWLELSG